MNNEYIYYDKNGKEIVTLGEPIEDIIQRFDNMSKHVAELEIGLTQNTFQNKAKDEQIKELKKQIKKYRQYKGLYTVCSKQFIQALERIDELESKLND